MFRSVVLAAVAFVLMGNPVHAEEISLRCIFTDGSKLDWAVRQTVHGKPGKKTFRHFSVVENGREGNDIVGDISNRIVHLVFYSTETGKDVIVDLPTGKARKRAPFDRTADQFGKAITGQCVKMPAATGKP